MPISLDQIVNDFHNVWLLHGCEDSFFVIYLLVYFRFGLVFAFLDEDWEFPTVSTQLRQLFIQLSFYTKRYGHSQVAIGNGWDPGYLDVRHFGLVFGVKYLDEVFLDDVQLLQWIWFFWIPYCRNYIINLRRQIVNKRITFHNIFRFLVFVLLKIAQFLSRILKGLFLRDRHLFKGFHF